MTESIENNDEALKIRLQEFERVLEDLYWGSKRANMDKNHEEVMRIGELFQKTLEEFEAMGGSWKEARKRIEDKMFERFEENKKSG